MFGNIVFVIQYPSRQSISKSHVKTDKPIHFSLQEEEASRALCILHLPAVYFFFSLFTATSRVMVGRKVYSDNQPCARSRPVYIGDMTVK
jgi:hypothetical protein